MNRLLTLALASLCATAIVSAQAPYPAPQQPSPQRPAGAQPSPPAQQPSSPSTPSSSAASSADKVTYSGCLKPGTTAGTWVLESAQLSPAAGSAASASSPSANAAVGTSGAKQTLNLTIKPSDNLTPHANHKIEVTGVASPAIAASMNTPETPSAGANASSSTTTPRLNFTVDSFKMVSATCP